MYGHHVIDDLNHLLSSNKKQDPIYKESIDFVLTGINKSQHFYLGEFRDFVEPLKTFNKNSDPVFLGCCGENIRLPYKNCWFEFDNKSEVQDDPEEVPKRCVYVTEIQPDFLLVQIVNYAKQIKKWMLSPQVYFICVGKTYNESPKIKPLFTQMLISKGVATENISKILDGNIHPVPTLRSIDTETSKRLALDDHRDLFVLNSALLLLSCKNIETEEIPPPEKLNKKRKKQGKQELFTYKTLKLSLPSKFQNQENIHSESKVKTRIHLCRGHFKKYDSSAPLFGKYTGMYWFQPHVRGDKKAGIVIKDYDLSVTDKAN